MPSLHGNLSELDALLDGLYDDSPPEAADKGNINYIFMAMY